MDGNLRLSNKERTDLRERFLKKAAAAFERMFGKANQDQLVTFTQREDLACLLAEDMAASLLEEHAAKDTQARPTQETACCPQCQKPGKRVSKRNEELEERPLTTRAGHDAAHAWKKSDRRAAWQQYVQWLRWAWSGQVKLLLASLRRAATQLDKPSATAGEDDPRHVLADTLGYIENNRTRMDYARYRRLGLPISSAPVESTIKQINRRLKGSEKFWLNGGAEAMLQLRGAYLSQDDRARAYWSRPRPFARAVSRARLRQAA
jgi:hypothetical protein